MSPNASASSKPVMDIEKRYSGQWCHKNCERGKVECPWSLHKIKKQGWDPPGNGLLLLRMI